MDAFEFLKERKGGLCVDPDRKCEDCRREFWMQEAEKALEAMKNG